MARLWGEISRDLGKASSSGRGSRPGAKCEVRGRGSTASGPWVSNECERERDIIDQFALIAISMSNWRGFWGGLGEWAVVREGGSDPNRGCGSESLFFCGSMTGKPEVLRAKSFSCFILTFIWFFFRFFGKYFFYFFLSHKILIMRSCSGNKKKIRNCLARWQAHAPRTVVPKHNIFK